MEKMWINLRLNFNNADVNSFNNSKGNVITIRNIKREVTSLVAAQD